MKRVFNVPLVLATVTVLAAAILVVGASVVQRDSLARSAHTGSDGVQYLSADKILALRAQSDDSLRLLTRGSDPTYAVDFDNVAQNLTGGPNLVGLMTTTVRWALGSGNVADVSRLTSDMNGYLAQHRGIAKLEENGAYDQARKRTIGSSAAQTLDADLASSIAATQARFESTAADASAAMRWVGLVLLVLIAAAVLLSSIGLKRRLDEYR